MVRYVSLARQSNQRGREVIVAFVQPWQRTNTPVWSGGAHQHICENARNEDIFIYAHTCLPLHSGTHIPTISRPDHGESNTCSLLTTSRVTSSSDDFSFCTQSDTTSARRLSHPLIDPQPYRQFFSPDLAEVRTRTLALAMFMHHHEERRCV